MPDEDIYRGPLHRETDRIDALTIGVTAGSVSLVISPFATLSFDFAGRPIALYEEGYYYARGMDGRCLEKRWEAQRRRIRALEPREAGRIKDRSIDLLRSCAGQVPALAAAGRLQLYRRGSRLKPSAGRAVKIIRRLLSYGLHRLEADEKRFGSVYNPIGILPPDQYLSLVVQVAEGCAWNRCTFCSFYAGRTARVRTRAEISGHIRDLSDYFGASLRRRRSLFLGDANAFQAPPDHLLWACREAARAFPRLAAPQGDGVGGLYAFGETVRLLAWAPQALAELRETGMRRVYIGLETGSEALRRWIRKPGTGEQVLKAVRRLKDAGIQAGLVVLLGLGGRENQTRHLEETQALLDRMILDPRDIVYFSPLATEPGSVYAELMEREAWTGLTGPEQLAQAEEIKAVFGQRGREKRPKTALYDVREFVY